MRERWFFAQGEKRRGPFRLADLVRAVRNEPDPRAVLVWRKGLRDWTLAEAVPEVARRLAPGSNPDDTLPLAVGESQPRQAPVPSRTAVRLRVGFASLAALAGIAALVLQVRSSSRSSGGAPGPAATNTPPAVVPATPLTPRAASPFASTGATPTPAPAVPETRPAPGAPALADEEASLPDRELAKLRGVAAWSGDTLKLTVYNATSWRLTELSVRIERFTGEDVVADDRPLSLRPPGPRVDAGVADLLARVAPDRKKPGLNPLDTGIFEARAGASPEGFRWEIASARGYPPAR
jgi:hypothetical protein